MSNPATVTPTTPAVAPAQPAPEAPKGIAKKPNGIAAQRTAFLEKVNAAVAAVSPESAPAPAGDDAPAPDTQPETPEGAVAAPAVDGEVPPKAADETPRQYAHRVAAAQLAAQRAEERALAAGERATASDAKAAELQAKLDEAAKDVHKALALAGYDPVKLAEAMRDGTLTPAQEAQAKLELPPEVLELVEQGKKAKAKAEQDAKDAEAAEVYKSNLKTVSDVVNAPDFQAEFPALGGALNASERLLSYITAEMEATGAEPDFKAVAKLFNDAIVQETTQLLGHAPTLKVLLGNADLKAAILKELGLAKASPTEQSATATAPAEQHAKGSASKTITNKVASKVPSRAPKASSSDDLAARLRAQQGL
jgi:hypothetical protein